MLKTAFVCPQNLVSSSIANRGIVQETDCIDFVFDSICTRNKLMKPLVDNVMCFKEYKGSSRILSTRDVWVLTNGHIADFKQTDNVLINPKFDVKKKPPASLQTLIIYDLSDDHLPTVKKWGSINKISIIRVLVDKDIHQKNYQQYLYAYPSLTNVTFFIEDDDFLQVISSHRHIGISTSPATWNNLVPVTALSTLTVPFEDKRRTFKKAMGLYQGRGVGIKRSKRPPAFYITERPTDFN
jgi:hypothetical protein